MTAVLECPPGLSSHHLFTVVWNRQTWTQTFIFSQICFSSLLQRRENSKYRPDSKSLDIVVNAVTETSSWFLTASFSNTHLLQFLQYFFIFTVSSRVVLAPVSMGQPRSISLTTTKMSLDTLERAWQLDKDKPLTTAAFTHSNQIKTWLMLKLWNYR